MQASIEQLSQIIVFAGLEPSDKISLQPHTQVQRYKQGEIILHEGDRLPAKLYAVVSGTIQITKTANTGKETILRMLDTGEIFAAPALLGNGISPATVTAETDCEILTVERDALLNAIGKNPDIALRMLMVLNHRIQQLHETVHGLVSERAVVRLARLILYFAAEYGTESSQKGEILKVKLPYYRIARSIGITYEECVRLVKSLKSVVAYSRGGKMTIVDAKKLESVASGNTEAEIFG
ncbi:MULTISPECIES: Crp/Fnr family transcriptional regulator [Fischerella]|uniref:Crp/Fnr family transcriptional regulator n=1 Tax=Fischerella muscicola CCMEE 5323 TaxID=2019572 RepID=A0A2N6JUN1_FISMU|nr:MULTISPECIES: Crp/Fnr family transcriptional regulator [Fischerella]MBD2432941.1 Crp/Fnr family transcriptional regulator [Fischerella sp. FACHB-380]PLZ81852.1 Crp/Fnr family transcriptional regulator [Fischerella muscicola CCMEE 5323]